MVACHFNSVQEVGYYYRTCNSISDQKSFMVTLIIERDLGYVVCYEVPVLGLTPPLFVVPQSTYSRGAHEDVSFSQIQFFSKHRY